MSILKFIKMAGISYSVQQFIKQELTECSDSEISTTVKQENFTPEKVKYSLSNGEYLLDINSPEFDLQNIATVSPIIYDQSECILFSKSEVGQKINVEIGLSIENVEAEINRSKDSVRNLEHIEQNGIKSNYFNKENFKYNIDKVKTESMETAETDLIIKEEIIYEDPNFVSLQNQNIQVNILSKNHNNNTIKTNIKEKNKSDKRIKKKNRKPVNKVFSQKITEIRPTVTKTGESSYECPYCGYKSRYEVIFQDHMKSHQNLPLRKNLSFSCESCNFECNYKYTFELHMNRGHSEEKMLNCFKCNYKNTCASQFKLHLSETGHKAYKCSECDLEFGDKIEMKRHFIDHEMKMYECAECKKVMKYKHLQRHLLTHAKPFECSLCGYKASSTKRIQDHILIHKNEKPFECQVCKKTFRVEQHLKRHLPSHQIRENRKLYECDVCKKTFTLKQTLKGHYAKQHGSSLLPV